MNIIEFWEDRKETPTYAHVAYMIAERHRIFLGFIRREQKKGAFPGALDINTPSGQDVMRSYLFRVIEEIAESLQSADKDHILEELIDAINYLWILPFVAGESLDRVLDRLVAPLSYGFLTPYDMPPGAGLDDEQVAYLVMRLAGELPDTFRNRSWMENAQDDMFTGWDTMYDVIIDATRVILQAFRNWDEFNSYYWAKHKVLDFRLETNY